MTHFPKLFNSYNKMTKKQLVKVANGDRVPIRRSKSISSTRLESSITLKDLL